MLCLLIGVSVYGSTINHLGGVVQNEKQKLHLEGSQKKVIQGAHEKKIWLTLPRSQRILMLPVFWDLSRPQTLTSLQQFRNLFDNTHGNFGTLVG